MGRGDVANDISEIYALRCEQVTERSFSCGCVWN